MDDDSGGKFKSLKLKLFSVLVYNRILGSKLSLKLKFKTEV